MRMMVLAAALALAGCSMGSDMAVTDMAVKDFHARLDAGKFSEIQDMAGPEVKSGATSFAGILAAVHDRLGSVRSTKRSAFNDKLDNGVHTVEMTYDTMFDKAPATEDFVYRINAGQAELIGYYVKSPALN